MADGAIRRIIWRDADIARVLGIAFLFLFLWKFFWMVHSALFLGLLSVLIAIVLHVPARWLSRWIPFRVAFALVILVFLASLGGLLLAMIPQLLRQVTMLATELPAALDSATEWVKQKTGGPPDPTVSRKITEQAAQFAGRFVPMAFNAISTALGSVALVMLAIFLAAEPRLYRDLLLGLIPAHNRASWERIYDEAGENLRAWVIGKALTMAAVGLVTWVGLTLLDVPGALALACFAALMEFIPNIGPTIAAAPAVVAAFSISPRTALYVAIFYFLLQQVQNAITVPLVERKAVNIPPAALLVWQLMLTIGFGILALFVATPLLAVLVVAVRILWVEPAEERERWDRREAADKAEAEAVATAAAAAGAEAGGGASGAAVAVVVDPAPARGGAAASAADPRAGRGGAEPGALDAAEDDLVRPPDRRAVDRGGADGDGGPPSPPSPTRREQR